MKTLTKDELIALQPCADGFKFAESLNFDFEKIYDKCPSVDWLFWLCCKVSPLTKPQAVQVSILCASKVLPTFEAQYPDDLRPRRAIDAAWAVLVNDTPETRYAALSEARSAWSAARSADSAWSAARSADSAWSAARAAESAASSAAWSAADSVSQAELADLFRSVVPNPFKP